MNEAQALEFPEMGDADSIRPQDLPRPVGWQLLIKPYFGESESKGGIILPDDTQNANKHLNVVGQVIAMGELCYTDDRFKVGDREAKAWCKPGDWVLYNQNIGQKLTIYDTDNKPVVFLFMNDDNIKCVVESPKNIRAWV
jgi:co-chaperonin GroES (HSP10)